jgi:UrcA family protein
MKTTALVTTLLIGCLAVTAHATTPATAEKVRQSVVSYADLNLGTEAGAQTLLRRIKFAARRVCGVNDAGLMAMEFRAPLHRCAEQATARAVADVDARTIVVADAR